MEGLILLELGFNLQIPTLPQFTEKIIRDCKMNAEAANLTQALVDFSLLDFQTLNTTRKFELGAAIAYFVAKVYKLDSLKM